MKKALALFAIILLFSFTTFAQSTASANATVTAQIAKGLAITNIGGSSGLWRNCCDRFSRL